MGNDVTTDAGQLTKSDPRQLTDDEWRKLSVRLTRYAFACVRYKSWHDAEDMAQEAITQLFDPEYKRWDPALCPDLFAFLARIVTGLANNRWQKKKARKYVYIGGADLAQHLPPEPPPQEALGDEHRGHVIMQTVHERAAKDELLLKVLGLLEARVDTTREHAEHIGCTMDEARSARRRLANLLKKIQAELDAQAGGDQ